MLVIVYADDLAILATSQRELQERWGDYGLNAKISVWNGTLKIRNGWLFVGPVDGPNGRYGTKGERWNGSAASHTLGWR